MNYLKTNGYTPLFVTEIKSAINYEKPIIITFDDGYVDTYLNAFSILKKHNFKADIYLITDWLNTKVYLTTAMIKEMDESSLIEFGSHTLTHARLGLLSEIEIERQLEKSHQFLEELLNKPINTIAYPTGSYNSKTIEIAKKYYKFGLTVNNDFEYSTNNHNLVLNRIKVERGLTLNNFEYLLKEKD